MSKPIFTLNYPELRISGSNNTFPVHRIYCVGQNYAAHTIEMGGDPNRDAPFFFSKPANAACQLSKLPWPSKTENLHYEAELVVAIGKSGSDLSLKEAEECIYAYTVGVDLTRRDLQAEAKSKGRPWDTSKGFDFSAPVAALMPAKQWQPDDNNEIKLSVNDDIKQQATLSQLIWKIPELIRELSMFYHLSEGDLIFTGTPAGVGKLSAGDQIHASVEGLPELSFKIG